MKPNFGPFEPLFLYNALYLSLLNLSKAAPEAVESIEKALESDDAEEAAIRLLRDMNWRPHLVGAVAAILAPSKSLTEELWKAIDRGSWVTPQLAAAALLTDPNFAEEAEERLLSGCGVELPNYSSMLERHSAAGPAGAAGRSGKTAASLVALGAHVPAMESLIREFTESSAGQEILAEDFDDSGEIASGWLAEIRELAEDRGRRIEIPSSVS